MTRVGTFDFVAPLWLYPGESGWHFVTAPVELSAEIADITAGTRRGFGSVRVAVTVGGTSWRTSIFPSSTDSAYLLPVKKSVRAAEQLAAGDVVRIQLKIVDL